VNSWPKIVGSILIGLIAFCVCIGLALWIRWGKQAHLEAVAAQQAYQAAHPPLPSDFSPNRKLTLVSGEWSEQIPYNEDYHTTIRTWSYDTNSEVPCDVRINGDDSHIVHYTPNVPLPLGRQDFIQVRVYTDNVILRIWNKPHRGF